MKLYLIPLGTGILVGIIYALMQVRSPAPPAIALIGLLGMLIGEQVVPPVKRMLAGEPVTIAWFRGECVPKITGTPPNADTAVEPSASLPARSRKGTNNSMSRSRKQPEALASRINPIAARRIHVALAASLSAATAPAVADNTSRFMVG